jgi:hypothetical protein
MDVLMPMSRVRSVTETSMIFMTPMPPTSKEVCHRREQQRHYPTLTLDFRLTGTSKPLPPPKKNLAHAMRIESCVRCLAADSVGQSPATNP